MCKLFSNKYVIHHCLKVCDVILQCCNTYTPIDVDGEMNISNFYILLALEI